MSVITWETFPTTFGWYFFTPKIEDYDLSIPINVTTIQSGSDPIRFEGRFRDGNAIITEDMGWWLGPIPIVRPGKGLYIK